MIREEGEGENYEIKGGPSQLRGILVTLVFLG